MANAIRKKYKKLGKYILYVFCDLREKYTAHLWLKTTHLGEAKVGSSSQTLQKGCRSMMTLMTGKSFSTKLFLSSVHAF